MPFPMRHGDRRAEIIVALRLGAATFTEIVRALRADVSEWGTLTYQMQLLRRAKQIAFAKSSGVWYILEPKEPSNGK